MSSSKIDLERDFEQGRVRVTKLGREILHRKKRKSNFPHVERKFRVEQLQSHIWGRASLYMRKCANISPYMRRPLVMTLQLLHSEFPYIWGKFDLLFYHVTWLNVLKKLAISRLYTLCVLNWEMPLITFWSSILENGDSIVVVWVSFNSLWKETIPMTTFSINQNLTTQAYYVSFLMSRKGNKIGNGDHNGKAISVLFSFLSCRLAYLSHYMCSLPESNQTGDLPATSISPLLSTSKSSKASLSSCTWSS